MKWALVDSQNIINNIISYSEDSNYLPPPDLQLIQVNDWLNIGDNINLPQPTLSIDTRREWRLNALLEKRNQVIESGIEVNGNIFATDDSSINKMLQAISMQGLGIMEIFPRSWILKNGSIIQINYDEMKAVAIAIASRIDVCFESYMSLSEQIKNSDDPESININSGWPE